MQASLDQKQRLQQLFFSDGLSFDGKQLVRTGVTLPIFNYLEAAEGAGKDLVDQTGASWNPLTSWLRRVDGLRNAA